MTSFVGGVVGTATIYDVGEPSPRTGLSRENAPSSFRDWIVKHRRTASVETRASRVQASAQVVRQQLTSNHETSLVCPPERTQKGKISLFPSANGSERSGTLVGISRACPCRLSWNDSNSRAGGRTTTKPKLFGWPARHVVLSSSSPLSISDSEGHADGFPPLHLLRDG